MPSSTAPELLAASDVRRGYPTKPTLPDKGEGGVNIFRVFGQRMDAFRANVAVWLTGQPEKRAIIWEETATPHSKGNVRALSRSIDDPENPWRVTVFCPSRDGLSLLPSGHQVYKTRLAAMVEEGRHIAAFHDDLPMRVLDEQEIQGYKMLRDLPPGTPLHWYQLNPGRDLLEMKERMRGKTVMATLVLDTEQNGRIALTAPIDDQGDLKMLQFFGLSPIAAPPIAAAPPAFRADVAA